MARMTTFSRLLIAGALALTAFFGIRNYVLPKFASNNATNNTEQTATNNGQPGNNGDSNPGTSESKVGATWTPQAFTYTPAEPINGKYKAVIEVGATGYNYFIIKVDAQKRWKLERAEFGASLVKEGMASTDDVKGTLKTYIADIVGYGVPGKDIHFVISSGAKKAPETQPIIAALKAMGYFVNEVTPEKEGQLALRCVLPNDYKESAFVVDIGSSNTKISWNSGFGISAKETYGSKYYQDGTDAATVYQNVRTSASAVPADRRETCFIIGGVPYKLAKQSRNGKERYTVLRAPLSYDLKEAKEQAGQNIYAAIADETGCQQFVFDWDANFTIGFLLNL